MKDICVDCNRKSYCMEPCEDWLIAHNQCTVFKTNSYILEAVLSALLEIGRSVVEMKSVDC